ncbi:MAG: PepSY domain-containing protein [Clostridiales bacterium]|nr:PepSY domain-containing protein [Clostridiales bacterium]
MMKRVVSGIMCGFIALQGVSVPAAEAAYDGAEVFEENPSEDTVSDSVTGVKAAASDGEVSDLITCTKELFGIGSGYDEFDYTYTLDDKSGLTQYGFNWKNTRSGETVYVIIDSNKYICNYEKGETGYSGLGTVTAEEARAAADSFLSLVVPEEYIDNVVYEPGNRSDKYYNVYRYSPNGIPYDDGRISLRVSKYTGRVISYDAPYDCPFAIDYPVPESIISAETAHSLYNDCCALAFEYRDYYDYQKKGYKLFPAYFISYYTAYMLDAFTGESMETEYDDKWAIGGSASSREDAVFEEETAEDSDYSLTEAEIASIANKADILTAEEALAIVEREVPIPDKTNITSELEKQGGEYYWDIDVKSGDHYVYMYINAGTGEVLRYWDDNEVYKSEIVPDYETMLETAEKVGEAFSSEKFENTEPEYQEFAYESGNVYGYEFNFVRTLNGIKYRENFINTGFNAAGKFDYYYTFWHDDIIELPGVEDAIGFEAAYDRFFEIAPPVLTYIKTDEGVRLVYIFGYDEVCLDKYGDRIGPFDGLPYTEKEEFSGYTDIEGSRCETVIIQLYNNGYYIEREEFKPDEPISPADFAAFFKLKGKETEQGYVFDRIADKYYGDTLTRYEAAEILASLKVDAKILSSGEIYSSRYYKDEIDYDYLPCVAVCYILGYMKGDNSGCFNGDSVVTNGEAAVILYNYLTS